MAVTVAIHQPNFFPWLGFFDKWMSADVFVLLDDVQFPKSGGTWTNRCRILLSAKPTWLTVPVMRNYSGFRAISEMEYRNSEQDVGLIMSRLHHAYSDAPYFAEVFPLISAGIQGQSRHLLTLNLHILRVLSEQLALPADRIVLSSSLGLKSKSTERLCDIVRTVGGDTYLSGRGAGGYQDLSLFARHGIQVELQSFTERPYQQIGISGFVPGLSILDALMNNGFDEIARRISFNAAM